MPKMYARISITASTIRDTAIKLQRIAVLEKGLHRIKAAKIRVRAAPMRATNQYFCFRRSISMAHCTLKIPVSSVATP